MKRNKLMALLGAAVLTIGVVGTALAEDLLAGQVGQALSSFDQDCTDFDDLNLAIGAGEIGVHFVLTDPDADSAVLQAVFSTDSVSGVASVHHGNSTTLHFYVVITGDLDTTITSASTDIDGGNLVISHVCAGAEVSSSTTSFESSEESSTDSQSSSTSEESSSSTTSFESSEESTTDSQSSSTASSSSTTSFSDSVSDTTSQPPTDTIGNTGSGQQSSGLWMLLAALGVLGGSIIVLAPSKAKTKE